MTPFTPNQPGYFPGLDEKTYRQAPGLNQSLLKEMARSPAHFKHAMDHPKEQTPAMIIGTIMHSMVLTPCIPHGYPVKPEGMSFATKEGKAFRDSYPPGTKFVSAEDEATARACADSIMSHPEAGPLMRSAGDREASMFATYNAPSGDVLLKGRADFAPEAWPALVDLKKCQDASREGFSKHINDFRCHTQAAFYLDLWNKLNPNEPRERFVFVAVEEAPPYVCAVYELSSRAIEIGRREWQRLVNLYAFCRANNEWPGYDPTITLIDLPAWAMRKEGLL